MDDSTPDSPPIVPPPAPPGGEADSRFIPLELPRAIVIPPPLARALPIARGTLILRGISRTIAPVLGRPLLPLLLTIGVFAGMMAVSFSQGIYGIATMPGEPSLDGFDALDEPVEEVDEQKIRVELIRQIMIFEGVDTALVFLGLLVIARPRTSGPQGTWPYAWLLAPPALALVLTLNIGFAYLLRTLLNDGQPSEEIGIGWNEGLVAILLICAQPAIIEELFFRHLLLGHLRPHVGIHFAVLISSVVFGMAHLGNMIGWPILILAGVMMGYARVYSGGLILPILLHFFHNFFVLLLNHLLFQQ